VTGDPDDADRPIDAEAITVPIPIFTSERSDPAELAACLRWRVLLDTALSVVDEEIARLRAPRPTEE
jgi:hypothetical protein